MVASADAKKTRRQGHRRLGQNLSGRGAACTFTRRCSCLWPRSFRRSAPTPREFGDQGSVSQISLGRRLCPRTDRRIGTGNPKHRLLSQQSPQHPGLLSAAGRRFDGQVPEIWNRWSSCRASDAKRPTWCWDGLWHRHGVVVDTHVDADQPSAGADRQKDAVKIERDLMELLPPEWVDFSHRLIHHGRQICMARRPKCGECTLDDLCPKIGVAQGKRRQGVNA